MMCPHCGERFAEDTPRVYRLGNVSLDQASRLVTVAGRARHIQPKDFVLLEHMIRRPGFVFSYSELTDALELWDAENENIIAVHVHRVRRAIHGATARITNRFGYGYVMELGRCVMPKEAQ